MDVLRVRTGTPAINSVPCRWALARHAERITMKLRTKIILLNVAIVVIIVVDVYTVIFLDWGAI